MLSISASVGSAGANKPDDVMIIQALLNKNIPVPLKLLDLSGVCDDQTIFTITEFQRRKVPGRAPDGRVDPGGQTFLALTGQAPASQGGGPYAKVTSTVLKPGVMRQSAWDYLLAFTVRHEGMVLNMYNNRATEEAKQDVTCGIGVLLSSPDAAASADIKSMFFDPATNATPSADQMKADWDAASKLLRTGKNLDDYATVCHMRMFRDKVIDKMATILRDLKLPALLKYKEYAGFETMPAAAQTFCLSFAYGRIPFDFPHMNACIADGDYAGASSQCRLGGASERKNQAHANLLRFAQKVVDEKLNFDLMPAGLDGL